MTEASGRVGLRAGLFALLIVAMGVAGLPNWLGLPALADAGVLLVPLLAVTASVAAAMARVDLGAWRIEAPFLATTLTTLGPNWTLAAWAGGRVGALVVRPGMMAPRRALQESGAVALAVGVALWVRTAIALPVEVEASAWTVVWLLTVHAFRRSSTRALLTIFVVSLIGGALAGLVHTTSGWWSAAGVVPAFLLIHIAVAERQTERNLDQTLQALALMLQRAHPYTHAHIERVARIAERTARLLGLDDTRARHVHAAARFHDIGKIAVDEQILDKPGALSEEEYDHVKLHAPFGAAILEEIRECRHYADWIRFHHERPDGAGYPNGLRGDQIPIEARIIAVADAFDAMTGGFEGGEPRPYRQPMSPKDALAELERCAGTQFDRQVVAAFHRALDEEATL